MSAVNEHLIKRSASDMNQLAKISYNYISPKDVGLHVNRIKEFCDLQKVFETPADLSIKRYSLNLADLFCGCGGLSIGFEMSGLPTNFALDNNKSALETFAINRSEEVAVCCSDIDKYLSMETDFRKHEIVIGGPPCQGFSNANRQRKGFDERNFLYSLFLEYANRVDADIVVIENVVGILKAWGEIEESLKLKGYSSRYFELEAFDYGAPQKRKRIFIIGIRNLNVFDTADFFDEIGDNLIKEKASATRVVLEQAIFDLPKLDAKTVRNSTKLETDKFGYTIAEPLIHLSDYANRNNVSTEPFPLFNHRSKYNNDRDLMVFNALKEGGDNSSEEFHRLNPYRDRDHIFKDKFYRLDRSKPSKTITAHMYYDCHMYVHPEQNRGLTPREAARVQGFPDEYVFLGKPNEWYRQIGNAVSPIVSRALARSILPVAQRILR